MVRSQIARWSVWPHRITALIVLLVILAPSSPPRIPDMPLTAVIMLLPYVLLEGVAHIAPTNGAKLVFGAGSVSICATALLYAPSVSGAQGEWAPAFYEVVPVLQGIGIAILAVILAVVRLIIRVRQSNNTSR